MNQFANIPDIPPNVEKFVAVVAKEIGSHETFMFKCHCEEHFVCCLDNSPVEQLLFSALSATAHVWHSFSTNKIEIEPQKKLENIVLILLYHIVK